MKILVFLEKQISSNWGHVSWKSFLIYKAQTGILILLLGHLGHLGHLGDLGDLSDLGHLGHLVIIFFPSIKIS